jgi:hypothetical protein
MFKWIFPESVEINSPGLLFARAIRAVMTTNKVLDQKSRWKKTKIIVTHLFLLLQDSMRNRMILLSEPPVHVEVMIIHLESIFPIPLGEDRLLKHYGNKSKDERVGQHCSIVSLMGDKEAAEGNDERVGQHLLSEAPHESHFSRHNSIALDQIECTLNSLRNLCIWENV